MSRLDLVREFVEKHYWETADQMDEKGVDAGEVAQALSIWRSDASADLNELYRQGVLKKKGKRPVLFYPADDKTSARRIKETIVSTDTANTSNHTADYIRDIKSNSAFRGMVGYAGSLKGQIQMAKASVLYPPHGLHTLIIGETGVGKSMMAEEMWRFAVENDAFHNGSKETPFIAFNCSEYADNPQLLLSQLFGHVKGAYTGANSDKAGLVEKANGGILFLDEIHRLPATGQEMLFMLIDKGQYRRLGDTKDRNVSLMIICATTEDPSSILLQTFKRRIPVQIVLPSLTERPGSEKMSLIGYFLSQEANRLNAAIWISGKAFQALVSNFCKTNIGDLKSTLQLSCAKSYLSYLSSNEEKHLPYGKKHHQQFLTIDVNDLPAHGYVDLDEMSVDLDLLTQHVFSEGMTAFPGVGFTPESFFKDYELSIDLYGYVERQVESYRHMNMTQGEIKRLVTSDLDKYYSKVVKAIHNSKDSNDRNDSILHSIISQDIWNIAKEILSTAAKRLDRNYSRSIQAALALHLQQLKERERNGQTVFNPDIAYMKMKYEAEISIVRSILPHISGLLGMTIPEDEVGYLSMFLSQPIESESPSRVGLIVVAHGRSTATSMAEFVNQLLSTEHIKGVNAPINTSMLNVYSELCKTVIDCDQGKGVLLLVDMGSFTNIEEDLYVKTGIACKVIPNVSSALVLEAGKVVISSSESLDEIYEKISDRYGEFICSTFPNSMIRLQEQNRVEPSEEKPIVLTICATGIGSAKKIGQILMDQLDAQDVEIRSLSALDDVRSITKEFGNRVKCVVGSFNPKLRGIPFFNTEAVLAGDRLHEIKTLLHNKHSKHRNSNASHYTREDALRIIQRQIKRFAPSFGVGDVMKRTTNVANRIEKEMFHTTISTDTFARIILHSASMLERLRISDIVPMPPWGKGQIEKNRNQYMTLKTIMDQEMFPFGFAVPDSELAYMLVNLVQPCETVS